MQTKKTTTLGPEFFGPNFDPHRLTTELKVRGFEFLSETCPIKFAGSCKQEKHNDGSVTFTQEIDQH